MSQITWNGAAGDGMFFTPGNWIGGVAPGPGDDAFIPAGFRVQSPSGEINSLGLAAGSTVTVLYGDRLTIDGAVTGSDPSGTSRIDGSVSISDNASILLDGTLAGAGTVTLASIGDDTDLIVGGTGATLSGGGTVVLGDASAYDRIYGASGGDVLVDAGDLIEGAGQLGAGQLTFVNDAVVDATGARNALVLDAATTNAGTLEATGTAGLAILNSTVINIGGTIAAIGTGVAVDLENATIEGGTLATRSGGAVISAYGDSNTLDGATDGAVTNAGTLVVADNSNLDLLGTLVNSGIVSLASTGDYANLIAAGTVTTITGGGTIVLADASPYDRIYGASGSDVLTNIDNLIEGSGQLGVAQLAFTNDAVVDATGTANALVLDAATTNTGTLEATGTAGLAILNSTVIDAGGTIAAIGTGVAVDLENATIEGGLLATRAGGTIVSAYGYSNTLDGATDGAVTDAGTLVVADNSNLELLGTLVNSGIVSLASAGDDTNLITGAATVTLSGGGTVVLGDAFAYNRIYGASGSDLLVNDETIAGSGQLGVAQLTFTNNAVVDATGAQNALVLDAAAANAGTLEATGTAGLAILNSTVIDAGGTIAAIGTGVAVDLENATIEGGLLATQAGGTIVGVYGYSNTLDGATDGVIANAGTLVVADNSNLDLLGTLVNSGTVSLASTGDDTNLIAAGTVTTITGGGTIVLGEGSAYNRIYGASGSDVLVNDETILGTGQLGAGQLTLDNEGTIAATDGGLLDLNATLLHAGLLEMEGSSTHLEIDQAVSDGTVAFTGSDETLTLETPNAFGATLSGFVDGDLIQLANEDATAASLRGSVLAITLANGMELDYRLAAPIPGAEAFVMSYSGGTEIYVVGAACYVAGTLILTTAGEVRVEDLAVGDRVVTARDGGSRPVVWLGHRRVHGGGDGGGDDAPIRVRAGAFGDGLPRRDLCLSPDHAVFTDGVLIPIGALVDGETIVREPRPTVCYHHVELDAHDVILAEGLPAESYLDTGNRSRFANAPLVALRPDWVPQPAVPALCAPMVVDGPVLAATRERLRRMHEEAGAGASSRDRGAAMPA